MQVDFHVIDRPATEVVGRVVAGEFEFDDDAFPERGAGQGSAEQKDRGGER